jgi:hypothetical protein
VRRVMEAVERRIGVQSSAFRLPLSQPQAKA